MAKEPNLPISPFQIVSALISYGDSQTCTDREVKLDKHDIDFIIEVAKRMKHVELKHKEVIDALSEYYLAVIKPANPYIESLRFNESWQDNGMRHDVKILEVYATIRVNLKLESHVHQL